MIGWLKRLLWRVLGKDPEAVIVSFCTGDPELCRRMAEEIRGLEPARRHFVVAPPGFVPPEGMTFVPVAGYRALRRYRIGLMPVLLDGRTGMLPWLLAPRKILAYNTRLERHHLRCNLTSLLFWRGVPLDRIRLRPRWWPWGGEPNVVPTGWREFAGRPLDAGRRRVAVLSPYLPYPLSHGGAVRIFHLLREMAREFDVFLFAFTDGAAAPEPGPLADFCARVVTVSKPRYRQPRWSTLAPPEVHEYRSPAMREALDVFHRQYRFDALQVEYTFLADYGGDILVEHDVTFDLFEQVWRRERSLRAWWDWWRWRRYETRAVRRFAPVVVMSDKDQRLLGAGTVVENGVDLARFRPEPETPGARLLFIGSFRHFPNIEAYRFFTEHVWPQLRGRMTLTVVAGPDHLTYWRAFTDSLAPAPDARIRLLGFVEDVRPLYVEANLVIVPTTVSAGTNVKVLEAMAMERAVVSTPSGCAGLGLEHARSVWIAASPEEFAAGVEALIADPARRASQARAARAHAERSFDWQAIGEKQRALLRRLQSA
jgi:glycosyltransferase involved in cell wall biosynthesis